MTEQNIDDITSALLNLNGVESIRVETTITVTHRKRNTGEVDDRFNEIRERVTPEDALESIAEEHDCNYHGTVDVVGDFRLKDRFSHRQTIENTDDE